MIHYILYTLELWQQHCVIVLYFGESLAATRCRPFVMYQSFETKGWDHFALRPQKRGGLLGTGTGRQKSEGSTADTVRKRSERPWTAARTMELLRRCPLASAQRLVHCAIAVSTAVLGRVTRTMSVALLLSNNSKRKKSNFRSPAPPPYS